jgi:phosphatidylethanolamine/phosphatidyl-N-methylethanolamine N-methyltransferase
MSKNPGSLGRSMYFLGKFLRDPKRVASIVPSSRWLAEAMVRNLELEPGDVVLEYGPGTGSMTQVLDRKIGRGVRYLGIERDPGFFDVLTQRFPHLRFHRGSVEHVAQILHLDGLPRPKAIISGLPFVSMRPAVMRSILEATRNVLRKDGVFRTFTYVNAYPMPGARRLRELMAELFGEFTSSRPILRNVPPAIVLTGRP